MITTDTAPRVCACPDCLGLAADDSPLCADCAAAAPPSAVDAWQDARDELRAACAAGETAVARVWMRALVACEAAAVRSARGRVPTLPLGYAFAGAAA